MRKNHVKKLPENRNGGDPKLLHGNTGGKLRAKKRIRLLYHTIFAFFIWPPQPPMSTFNATNRNFNFSISIFQPQTKFHVSGSEFPNDSVSDTSVSEPELSQGRRISDGSASEG